MGKDLIGALVVSAAFIAGCASPEVVDVTRTSDLELTCKELETGIADAEGFRAAAQEEKGATGNNVAAAIFFWPALLVTYNNIDEATQAAEERKTRLADIYESKGCAGGAVADANGDGDAAKDGGTSMATAPDGIDYYDGLRAFDAGQYVDAAAAWEVAARANDAKAQYRLGEMHQSGQGVPQSFVKAHQYFNLAAAQGHEEARIARDTLARNMTPEDVSRAQKLAEDWRAAPAEPQVAALEPEAAAETPACGPVARDVTSQRELRQALVAYYNKNPIQRNPWHGTAFAIKSIEKLKIVRTEGNTLTIDVTYRAWKVHSGTAKVEACGSTYTVLSFA